MSRTTSPAAMRRIVEELSEQRGVGLRDLFSAYRGQPVAAVRQEAYWLCRQRGESYPQIGRFFGRDHSTIVHGVRAHERRRRP